MDDADYAKTSAGQWQHDFRGDVDQTDVRIFAVGTVQDGKYGQVFGAFVVENHLGILQPARAVDHFLHVRLQTELLLLIVVIFRYGVVTVVGGRG